jgi:RNA polymerase sigma factor (sigma-70 family)
MDDSTLLRAFAQTGDERAFRELVNRHIDLVYAAARRQVRDPHLAEDVSQAVFTLLARKAASLRPGTILPAWLHASTRYVARDVLRAQRRRDYHERRAQHLMKRDSVEPDDLHQMEPELDEALARLRESDRTVLTLRYLQGVPTASVAQVLGISTMAAEKRIVRAVAKLRESFARRGVVVPATVVSMELIKFAHPAPAGVAMRVADGALAAFHAMPPPSRVMNLLHSRWAGAGAALAALLCVGAFVAASISQTFGHRYVPPTAPSRSTAAASDANPIQVGVILSEFTFSGWHTSEDTDYGLNRHQTIFFHLQNLPHVVLRAIVEPGTSAGFKSQLPEPANYGSVIDGSDLDALRKLDVIVAGHDWHMRPKVLDAVDQAVQGGVGFMHQAGFAMLTPSFDKQVCGMIAMQHADFFYRNRPAVARVVAEHPVLKGLKVGDEIHGEMFYGAIGPIDGTPLVAGFDWPNGRNDAMNELSIHIGQQLHRPATQPSSAHSFDDGPVFCPVYISQHGKGRVIACQWHNEPPTELDPNHDGSFYLRCLEWLAKRPVQ